MIPRRIWLYVAIKVTIDTSSREASFVFETDNGLEFEDMLYPLATEIADESELSSYSDVTYGLKDGNIDPSYKSKAVKFWRPGK
ncbi:hypothetical protein Trydic_g11164 [Trypoxylus dichotomus]